MVLECTYSQDMCLKYVIYTCVTQIHIRARTNAFQLVALLTRFKDAIETSVKGNQTYAPNAIFLIQTISMY